MPPTIRLSGGPVCGCRTRSIPCSARPTGFSAASITTLIRRWREQRLICGFSHSRPAGRCWRRKRSRRSGSPGTATTPRRAPPLRVFLRRTWRCRPAVSSAPWSRAPTASTVRTRPWLRVTLPDRGARQWSFPDWGYETRRGQGDPDRMRVEIMSLKDHTLFITGASRGIGLAIALRAARDGANIAIAAKTDKPHPKLTGTIFTAADEVTKAGGNALPLVVDVRDEVQVKDAIERTVASFGRLDIVVNNASAVQRAPVADTDMRRFDLMHQVNTRGTLMVSKYAIPHLEKAENPHILMNSPPLPAVRP